jgi:translocation protein SEC63
VEFVTKAYKALTDEMARANLEKYGNVDGPQGMAVGIALPKFMLDLQGKSGGLLLACLVGGGILAPLLAAVIYLSRASKYNSNKVMNQTLYNYYTLMKPSLASR